MAKRGTLVDATIIAAAVKRPPNDGCGVNPPDPTRAYSQAQDDFGFTAHLAVDEGSGWCVRPNTSAT